MSSALWGSTPRGSPGLAGELKAAHPLPVRRCRWPAGQAGLCALRAVLPGTRGVWVWWWTKPLLARALAGGLAWLTPLIRGLWPPLCRPAFLPDRLSWPGPAALRVNPGSSETGSVAASCLHLSVACCLGLLSLLNAPRLCYLAVVSTEVSLRGGVSPDLAECNGKTGEALPAP